MCLATVAVSEVHYVIRPLQSQSCGNRYSSAAACVDNDFTLSWFVENSSKYLTNDGSLIFSTGNYSLNSEFIVENVRSFLMLHGLFLQGRLYMITCGHNARFEFRNVGSVTVSGLEFVKSRAIC